MLALCCSFSDSKSLATFWDCCLKKFKSKQEAAKALESELSKYEKTHGKITSRESPVIAKLQKKCLDDFRKAAQTNRSLVTEPRLYGNRCKKEGCSKKAQGAGGYCKKHGGHGSRCDHVEDGVQCKKEAQSKANKDGLKFCRAHGGKRPWAPHPNYKQPSRQRLCANDSCEGNNSEGNMAVIGGYCKRKACQAMRGNAARDSTISGGGMEAALGAAEAAGENDLLSEVEQFGMEATLGAAEAVGEYDLSSDEVEQYEEV
jgi:hypothetical protein